MKKIKRNSVTLFSFYTGISCLATTLLGINYASAQVIKTETHNNGKTYLVYKMQSGEYASEIAKDFKITLKDLAEANPQKDLNKLIFGESLLIPQEPKPQNQPKDNNEQGITRGEQAEAETEALSNIKYTAKEKENIYAIAKKHGTTAVNLRAWNQLTSDKITPGQELIVRMGSKKNSKRNIENKGIATIQANDAKRKQVNTIVSNKSQGKTRSEGEETEENVIITQKIDTTYQDVVKEISHTITAGETLASIAGAFETTQSEILKASNLPENYKIKTGDVITVPKHSKEMIISEKDNNNLTEIKPTEHKIKKGENLGTIAENYHVSIKELRQWNNIPENNDNIKFDQILKIYLPNPEIYSVKKGETWEKIAKKYGVSEKQILAWNNILEDENPTEKQEITIYEPAFLGKKIDAKKYNTTTDEKSSNPKPNAKITYHHIEEGDNFTKIRNKHNISSTEIKFWNNRNFNDDNLAVGDSLKLYLPIKQNHIVKKGETAPQIAIKYGVNTSQIRIWNNLKPKNDKFEFDIKEGQILLIYEPTGPAPTKEYLDKKKKPNQEYANDNKQQANKNAKITEKTNETQNNTNKQETTLKTHTIGSKETLYQISKIYNVSVDDLKKWNNLSDNTVREGNVLNVFVANTQKVAVTKQNPTSDNNNTNQKQLKDPTQNPFYKPSSSNKIGDGNLKVETPNPDADPLEQLSESKISSVIGEKNNDNEINKETENNNNNAEVLTVQGLMQQSTDIRSDERYSVLVRADKKHFTSVDITDTKTGITITASIVGEIEHKLSPSITLEATPQIMRAFGYEVGDVPSVKLEFRK